jgi:predicted GH43/DUF377 family glycosyl hydrolase
MFVMIIKMASLKHRTESVRHVNRALFAMICFVFAFSANLFAQEQKTVYKPVIDGDWHNITSQPDLGELSGPKQEPVDFGVWQASDGTWQLWSCIRGTKTGGKGRLFYRWEGKSLSDTAWKPMGIAMEADTALNENRGGLQAPYVLKEKGVYYMFYGDWESICLATSKDGKTFTRVINETKTPALFAGPLYNTRDPMVLKIGDTYYCYYAAHHLVDNKSKTSQGAIFCRTSKDLKVWGYPKIVARGGSALAQTSWFGGDVECPFVVKVADKYVLFRNQRYGKNALNMQYCSSDPLNFGDENDDYLVGQLPVAAPEIVKVGDQYYIVALKPGLDGMRIAKLKFVKEVK